MKSSTRSILITGILAIVATSPMVAQTSNGWFEQWYRAKYGRPSPSEQARLDTKQVSAATPKATQPAGAVSANASFEQWYRAKYGRPSPTEEARLDNRQVDSAPMEAPGSAVASSANDGFEQRYEAKYGHRSLTEQASLGQIPTAEHLNKHQLYTLVAAAKTPAQHQRIAQFYQSQTQDYLVQSKEHAFEAEQLRNNPMRVNNKTVFSTVNHCEYYAQKFSDLATKSLGLATQHEEMASDARRESSVQALAGIPSSELLSK